MTLYAQSNDAGAGLVFEWYSIARRIKAFFAKDTGVQTSAIIDGVYELTITAHDPKKAAALASILNLSYEIGNITGVVRVADSCGTVYRPEPIGSQNELLRLTEIAFAGNPRVRAAELYDFFDGGEAVVVIAEKALIQYYNGDLGDRYGNANIPVQDVLLSILREDLVKDLKLKATTVLCRDVE
jgi:hypothetical protein